MAEGRYIELRGARGDEWQKAIGTRTFPVTTDEPIVAEVLGDRTMAFFLDMTELDARTLDRITHYLAEKFRMPLDELRHEMKHGGVPILARSLRTPTGLEL